MVVKIANIWLKPLDLSGPIDSELKETSSKIQNQSSYLPSILKYNMTISLGAVGPRLLVGGNSGWLDFVLHTRCCAAGGDRKVRVFYERKDPKHTLFGREI